MMTLPIIFSLLIIFYFITPIKQLKTFLRDLFRVKKMLSNSKIWIEYR